jgi:hypothetical protein
MNLESWIARLRDALHGRQRREQDRRDRHRRRVHAAGPGDYTHPSDFPGCVE